MCGSRLSHFTDMCNSGPNEYGSWATLSDLLSKRFKACFSATILPSETLPLLATRCNASQMLGHALISSMGPSVISGSSGTTGHCAHTIAAPLPLKMSCCLGGGQSAEGTLTVRMPILRTWKHSSAQVYPTVNGQPRIRAACTVASRRFLGQSPVGILPHQRKSSRLRGKGSRPFRGQGWFQRTIATRHVLLLPFIPPDCEIWQQVTLGKATAHGLLPKVELKGSQGALKQV